MTVSMNGRFVSYLRVSTDKQGRSGLGLEAQREAVASYLNGGDWTLIAEYVEVRVRQGRRSTASRGRPRTVQADRRNPGGRQAGPAEP